MPRQIIDTESSRPAYVRRNATIVAFVILIVAVLAYAFFVLNPASRPANNPPARQPARLPGK